MHTRNILIAVAAAAVLAVAAFVLIPLLSPPEPSPSVAVPYWPTDEWRTGTPEDLQKIYETDVAMWRKIITDAKIQPN